MDFKVWVENAVRRRAIQDTVLNFLQDKLSISDPQVILNMRTSQLEPSVLDELQQRGVLNANPNLAQDLKSDITIQELIERSSL